MIMISKDEKKGHTTIGIPGGCTMLLDNSEERGMFGRLTIKDDNDRIVGFIVPTDPAALELVNTCIVCQGTGGVPSGMCHCGEDIDKGYCDNHSSVEMDERCEDCKGTGQGLPR